MLQVNVPIPFGLPSDFGLVISGEGDITSLLSGGFSGGGFLYGKSGSVIRTIEGLMVFFS